jgi:hypothetical protein
MSITAQFVAAPPPTLSVSVTGVGTVTRVPNQASYTPGTIVTLSAIPGTDWLFDAWSGDLVAGATPIDVLMDRSKIITAKFRPNGVLVTTDAVGPGSVTRSPDKQVYPLNSTLSLRALAGVGAHFMDWRGDTLCGADSLALTLTHDLTLHARFGYRMTVRDTALGTIQVGPGGSGVYLVGSAVTLVPKPHPGAQFLGWTGDASGNAVPLVVSMTADKMIGAVWGQDGIALTTEVSGSGSIVRQPDQPTYAYGVFVNLSPIPSSGWHFTGWTQNFDWSDPMSPDQCPACRNPQGSPLEVHCSHDLTLIAHFEQNPFPVAVLTSGRGSVSQSWVANDGPDSMVVLTAAAESGWQFEGWSGDLTTKDNPVRVQLAGAFNVTARFVPVSAAAAPASLVTELVLAAVAPNPTRGPAGVDFGLPEATGVSLDVLDIQGRQVATLIDGTLPAGRHHAEWNGRTTTGERPAGVFFMRLVTPQGTLTRRFVLTR